MKSLRIPASCGCDRTKSTPSIHPDTVPQQHTTTSLNMSSTRNRLTSSSFPVELLLEVIQHVPLDQTSIPILALVHSRLHEVLHIHERSIAKNHVNIYHNGLELDFPCSTAGPTYKWLARSKQRDVICDNVMVILTSPHVCYPLPVFNNKAVETGLHLLYRLLDIEDYKDKIAFINSLQLDPMTAILLAIHSSTLVARYHGLGYVNQSTYSDGFLDANELELRNDMEFCYAEGVMEHGPEFIRDILSHEESAERKLMLLYHEQTVHDWDLEATDGFMPPITQGPERDPETKPRTLYTTLLEKMGTIMQCELGEVVSRIVEDTDEAEHSLANLSREGKSRLLRGLDMVYADDINESTRTTIDDRSMITL